LTRPECPQRSDLAEVGVSLGGPGSALSGRDVAEHYGLPISGIPAGPLLVLTPRGQNREVAGVRLRRSFRPVRVLGVSPFSSSLAGLPIATVARAVADAALECRDLPSARALLTAAAHRGLTTPEELLEHYQNGPRNGSYFLRRAVHDVLNGARSVAEADAVDALVAGRVPAFEVNVPICPPGGAARYVVDVLWRSLRAALEIDSRAHHRTDADWLNTMRRHNALTSAGLVVAHWAPTDIGADPARFAAQVKTWLVRRAHELGVAVPEGHGALRASDGGPLPLEIRLPAA
jgi:hypothetical protein